jgi:hypothetical protein
MLLLDIDPQEPSLRRRIHWGASWGVMLSLVYCAFAIIQFTIQGPALASAVHVTPPAILAVYVAGGIVAGSVVGIALPIARSQVGAGVVGAVAVLPIFVMMRYAQHGSAQWNRMDVFSVVGAAVLVGGGLGLAFREDLTSSRE